jgi:predicted transcriptional regulator of viral defense system
VTVRLQEFFAQNLVVTHAAFAAVLDSEKRHSTKTRESLLAYHVGAGRLLRVRRGLYAVVPPGVSPETCPVDPNLLAANMTDDAVLAYHTALEFYGRAYSVHEDFLYLTNHVPRPACFRNHRFRGIRFPVNLRRSGQHLWGVRQEERTGLRIQVTGLERTLVDLLDRPNLGGGWEEIWRSLETIEFFDLDQIVEYALLLDNATTAAKVGFFLEQHRDALMVDDTHLRALRKRRPRRPHYLHRASRQSGHLVPEWNLIVPSMILKRSWQEVL